jgi:uncharacterized protein YkwD
MTRTDRLNRPVSPTGAARGQIAVRPLTARSRVARAVGLGGTLGVALALAACGGGGDSSDPSASPGAPVTLNAAAPAPDVATIASPSPDAAKAAAAPCGIADFEAQALARINQIRAQARTCGARGAFAAAGALAWNGTLDRAATGHSTDMAQRHYFSHTSPDGQTMAERVSAAGYRWTAVAENIAAGQADIAAALAAWVASDGHCVNLMGATYRDVALSCVRDASGTPYWTMNLARS